MTFDPVILVAVFVLALLYSSVGHAGASGYLAVLALAGVVSETSRPVALILNIFVATVASIQFFRAGHFNWRSLWPFAVTSVPLAFLGGSITLPTNAHKMILGLALIVAAFRLFWEFAEPAADEHVRIPVAQAALSGAVIGLVSGLTGVGGGIFLTPLLLLAGWARTKEAAAVSAVFILVNSIAGLAGSFSSGLGISVGSIWPWLLAALAGGAIGSTLGSRYFNTLVLRRVLSFVLLFAGVKLAMA